MTEQNLQVRFNKDGCSIEEYGNGYKVPDKGKREGRMFTLDASILELKATMFKSYGPYLLSMGRPKRRCAHCPSKL